MRSGLAHPGRGIGCDDLTVVFSDLYVVLQLIPHHPLNTAMSLPPSSYDPRRIFRFQLPKFNVGSKGREIGTYIAGGLVSCGL